MLVDSIGQNTAVGSFRAPFRSSRPKKSGTWARGRQRGGLSVHAESSSESLNLGASTSGSAVESTSKAAGQAFREGASSANAPSASNAANGLSDTAQSGASDLGSSIGEASRQALEAASSAPQAADSATQALDGTSQGPGLFEGLQNAFSDVNKSVTDAVTSLKDSLSDTISGGQQQISGSSDDLQRQVQDLRTDLTKQFEGTTGDVGKEITKQISGLSDAAGNAFQDASSGFESLAGAASGVAGDIGTQALQSANSALYTLPEPLRQTIENIITPIGQALEVPPIRNAALAVAVGYPTYLWFTARFGGFSGRLAPQDALTMLENEDSLLLDVRADLSRDAAGIPELRFGARNKGVALPLVRVKQKSGTQVVKASMLSFQVAAILVRGLGKVSSRSKVIVLSDSETQGVTLARAIATEINLQAYILKGGMSGWVAAGLPVKTDTEYESSAIAGFNDTVEGSFLPFVRDPSTILGAVILGLGITGVLIDEHKTLQFIGAFGLLYTFGTIPLRYNSLQEARNDILGPYLKAVNFVLGLVPKSKPSTTSVSSVSSSSSSASLPVSSPNGQKALPTTSQNTQSDGDNEYAEIFREIREESEREAGTPKKPDVTKSTPSKPETSSAKPTSEIEAKPAETSSKSTAS